MESNNVCGNCGKIIEQDAKFCIYCGNGNTKNDSMNGSGKSGNSLVILGIVTIVAGALLLFLSTIGWNTIKAEPVDLSGDSVAEELGGTFAEETPVQSQTSDGDLTDKNVVEDTPPLESINNLEEVSPSKTATTEVVNFENFPFPTRDPDFELIVTPFPAIMYDLAFISGRKIYAIDIPNGIVTPLTTQSESYSDFRISPDGRNIAYMVSPTHEPDMLYIADVDGSNPEKITDLERVRDIQWSPDGQFIGVMASTGNNKPKKLFLIDPVDGSQRELLQHGDFSSGISWSPDGSQILVATGSLEAQVYTVSVVDGTLSPMTNDASQKIRPEWSPNGEKFAYLCGPPLTLCLKDVSVEEKQRLYILLDSEDVFAWDPDVSSFYKQRAVVEDFAWSPDGEKIAINWQRVLDKKVSENLCVIATDNPGIHQCYISVEKNLENITWSPDGKHISFSTPTEYVLEEDEVNGVGLFILNTDSGELSLLTYSYIFDEFRDTRWIKQE